ncbi:DUF362 domain-containing protein [Desulfopila sp. IMCC35006]|uniref:DUF362 domain-containing protein n=1 Tax=Desulfopila sp. IMCC35006 TaxID=2569542 RepID=UPI0010AC7A6E|nr:DUF362 domain-containing protein [Desulfopila sp. IMCC35006]TKB26683.1 DUF362 domain-containing protein [Desulfopila sp. IMCC35006]
MNDALHQVVLQRCTSYDPLTIAACTDKIGEHLGLSGSLHGKVVLLKPNFISSHGPALACTDGRFIAAVAGWFLDQGARVLVGDSPAFGSAQKVCRTFGIAEALCGLQVKVINFTTPVQRRLAGGVSVSIAREALECDLFVGLPKIKAHNQMLVTMAVKNMFGIVKGVNKAMLHMVHGDSHAEFSEIILDLLTLLPHQIHLVDGIEVMHGSGPLDGSPLMLGCIAAARNPVALDTALLELLELDRTRSPLWQAAAKRGMAGSNAARLDYPLLVPRDFYGSGFLAPYKLQAIRFNPWRFVRGLVKRVAIKIAG